MRNPFARRAEPRLVRARIGVFGYFATSGFIMGCWAAGLPALDERLNLGPGRLGTVLLLIAGGALVSMLVVGRLCDRFTSRTVTLIAGPLTAAALLGPVLSGSYPLLCGLAVVYGLTVGVIEVSMNVNSLEVEARYRRPIVSAFHGLWSAGGALGGALTSLGTWLGMGAQTMLVIALVVACGCFVWFGRYLLPPPAEHLAAAEAPRGSGPNSMRWGLVLLLGIVAFSGHISEGAAIDWAAIHARRILDTPLSTAPMAYTVFG
ncbi:MAG: MFS transporter, partial [Stackebrandtia sp.]